MDAREDGAECAITAEQVRAGRALLNWAQDQLVAASGVPRRTLARFEMGQGAPQQRTLIALRAALVAAGVEFIPENGGGQGVRLREPAKPD